MSRRREKTVADGRMAILTTIAFTVALGILVWDFLDNGKIDNERFLIVALFVFSGAGVGRTVDAIIDSYINKRQESNHEE